MLQEAAKGERCKECFGFSSDLIPCVYCLSKSDREAVEDYYEDIEGSLSAYPLTRRRLCDLETALKETQATETEDRTLLVVDDDAIEEKTSDFLLVGDRCPPDGTQATQQGDLAQIRELRSEVQEALDRAIGLRDEAQEALERARGLMVIPQQTEGSVPSGTTTAASRRRSRACGTWTGCAPSA